MRASVHEEYRADADHWWFRARRAIFARLLDHLGIAADGAPRRILDLGPGSGVNLPALAGRGEVVVLDLEATSLRACRAAGALALCGDATLPPLADASFDLICALDGLEHLDDDGKALTACRRLLKPGGRLLLSVPALRVLWGRQDVLSQHRRRYGKRELADKLLAAGFAVERASYFNALLFLPVLAVRLLMRPFLSRTVASGKSDLSMKAPLGLDRVLYALFAVESRWLPRHDLPIGVSLLAIASPAPACPAPS